MILKNSFVAKFKETSGVTQDIYDDAFNDGKQEGIEQGKQEGLENAKNHLEEKRITKNGVYTATEPNFGFSKVEVRVDVPPDYVNPEGAVEITENGTYNVEHFEFAEVNVPIPDGYIKPSGTIELTSEGEFNVAQYETANVKMDGGGSVNPMQYYIDNNGTTPSCKLLLYAWQGSNPVPILEKLDTSKVTSFENAFYSSKIETLPLILDTSLVTDFSQTFRNCSKLKEAYVDIKSAYNVSYMFHGCSLLEKVKLLNAGASVGNAYEWFSYCEKLKVIDFRGATGIPKLSDNSSFSRVPTTCKIVVPDELYDSWIRATNWSAFGGTYVKASEYVEE